MTIVDGIAKGHFLPGSAGSQTVVRVAVVGSRVKHVWSGLGAGPVFLCPDHECRERALTVPRATQIKTGHLRRDAPTLSSYHSRDSLSIISVRKTVGSPFYTIYLEVICGISRLVNPLRVW